MTIDQLIDKLTREGGAIVSSGECSGIEIAQAQACGRFAVRDDGMGYVLRPADWLKRTKALPELIAAAECALRDFETINDTLVKQCRVHPFRLVPMHLQTAITNAKGKQLDEDAVKPDLRPVTRQEPAIIEDVQVKAIGGKPLPPDPDRRPHSLFTLALCWLVVAVGAYCIYRIWTL